MTKFVIYIVIIILTFILIRNRMWIIHEKRNIKPYGSMIKYHKDYISYVEIGNGKKNLILMSGYGEPSPYIDFKPLINHISKEDYTIYVIEPCGYGCSSFTKRKRTIEEFNNEINAVVEKREIKNFTFVCHSLSGIYALAYMNKYPEKVKSFIGIDCSVPEQIKDKKSWLINVIYAYYRKVLRDLGIFKFISSNTDESLLPNISNHNWSSSDEIYIRMLNAVNTSNSNLIEEIKNLHHNLKSVRDLHYTVPSLLFISEESSTRLKEWKDFHIRVLNTEYHNQIIELAGSHYLHYKYAKEIANYIDCFLNKSK